VAKDAVLDGNRVAQYLSDPAVMAAFERLEHRYYARFKSAVTPDGRTEAWACARVMDDIRAEMRAIVDNGRLETAKLAKLAGNE
jgi:hypothetical protein